MITKPFNPSGKWGIKATKFDINICADIEVDSYPMLFDTKEEADARLPMARSYFTGLEYDDLEVFQWA